MGTLLVHAAVLVVLPPLLLGLVTRTKSWVSGRTGPGVLQPYRDLGRLFGKAVTLSPTTTWVFRLGPVLAVATPLSAGLLVPLAPGTAGPGFSGDFVAVAYLLALGRMATVLAALDTGSSFEGMGASREVTFSALAEPALFLCLAVLVKSTGHPSLDQALGPALGRAWPSHALPLGLAGASLFLVFLAENCRIPVDDPTTHLELTMIHEVMVLDHSGPLFGLVLYGAAMKLFVFAALLAGLVVPPTGAPGLDLGLGLGAVIGVGVAVGVVESGMARLKLPHVPTLLVGACVLSAFGFLLAWR